MRDKRDGEPPGSFGKAWSTLGRSSARTDVATTATITPELFAALRGAALRLSTCPAPRCLHERQGRQRTTDAKTPRRTTSCWSRCSARGGMGRVFVARQRWLRRDVAVNVVRESVTGSTASGALLHEALVTGSLEHPNIVPVHALGRDDSERARPTFP